MTNAQAFRAALAPYVLPKLTVEFLLTQQGLNSNDEYDAELDVKALFTAVIDGLNQLRTLSKEKDPGTENTYEVAQLDALIEHYRKKYVDPDGEEEAMFIDRTYEW